MARGFLAALARNMRIAEQNRKRAERDAVRSHDAAVRKLEHEQRASERLRRTLAGAEASERKRLEKEVRESHISEMEAEAEAKNRELEQLNDDLQSILSATLQVDDYIRLESLKVVVEHPAFPHPELRNPLPLPSRPIARPEPQFAPIPEPTGLTSLFGRKQRAKAAEAARTEFEVALRAWQAEKQGAERLYQSALAEHAKAEDRRMRDLAAAEREFAEDSTARGLEVDAQNEQIARLIVDLGYGTTEAVQEYVGIVLSNSVYPETFQVRHDFAFEPEAAELRLRVLIPPPSAISEVKAYRYNKSSDEVVASSLSKKACKDRYASALHQVALRSLHEVFEADRRTLVHTISLQVGTETISPATGRNEYIPLVDMAVARTTFQTLNLSKVEPVSALKGLGASISRNSYDLVPVELKGVRKA